MKKNIPKIILTIILIIIFSTLIIFTSIIQSENQDLKNIQTANIKITPEQINDCNCPEIKCENNINTEEDNTPNKEYKKLTGLFTEYTVEYPLGWHVIDSGLEYFNQDEINTVYVHFNNEPITQVPRGGQPGTIALIDRSGKIPTFEKFLTEKKALFQDLTEENFTLDSDIKVYKLSGQTTQFEQWTNDVIYCLEYTDSTEDRHLVYSSWQSNFNNDSESSKADLIILDYLIKSFKINN